MILVRSILKLGHLLPVVEILVLLPATVKEKVEKKI
jgi:hypothetical protein